MRALALVGLLLWAGPLWGRTWWVDDGPAGGRGLGSRRQPFTSLEQAVERARDGGEIVLLPGRHEVRTEVYVDPICGNCSAEDAGQRILVTAGLVVRDKALTIRGTDRSRSVIVTRAGYGVVFDGAGESVLENLTVTGGRRDPDGRATSASVIARYTNLTVRGVDVIGNDHLYEGPLPDPVAGIIGIAGREGARLLVEDSRVLDNSWDGIALYRSDPEVPGSRVEAVVRWTEIGCASGCVSPRGRGAGIGVTWDAVATVDSVRVHHYWKGIGAFGESTVSVTNSVVEDQHGWGVIVTGSATLEFSRCVVARNGTVGVASWNEGVAALFDGNVIVGNGWNDEWVGKRTGAWLNDPDTVFTANLLWANESEQVCQGGVPGGEPCEPVPFDGLLGNLLADPEGEGLRARGLADPSAVPPSSFSG